MAEEDTKFKRSNSSKYAPVPIYISHTFIFHISPTFTFIFHIDLHLHFTERRTQSPKAAAQNMHPCPSGHILQDPLSRVFKFSTQGLLAHILKASDSGDQTPLLFNNMGTFLAKFCQCDLLTVSANFLLVWKQLMSIFLPLECMLAHDRR